MSTPTCKVMAETVIVHSLDLMELIGVSTSTPHILFSDCLSFVPVQPVSGVIDKDCIEAECLY